MKILYGLDINQKKKIHFIHFNHTNDVIRENTNASMEVVNNGYSISREGDSYIF